MTDVHRAALGELPELRAYVRRQAIVHTLSGYFGDVIQDVQNKTIIQLFDAERPAFYNVPKYQREYVWGRWNWDALFDDLIEHDGGEGHFLGTFICVNRQSDSSADPEFEVIDGQQRLTTLSLLLAAIYRVFKANRSEDDDDETIADRLVLQKMLVINKRSRLTPQVAALNHDDFESILQDAGFPFVAKTPAWRGNRRIAKAFSQFDRRIKEHADTVGMTEYEAARDLFARVKRAQMVKLEVNSFSDAFVLFESLNNRGTPLTPIDLIKNTLLARADKAHGTTIDEAYAAWEEWIDDLGDDYPTQERFFRQLYNAMKDEWGWTVKNAPIALKSNLIRIYEDLIGRDLIGFIAKLSRATKVYAQLTDLPKPTSSDRGLTENLPNLVHAEGTTAHVLLLFLFLKQNELGLTDVDLADIVSLLTAFSVRRNLTNVPATYALQRLFMDIIADLREDPSNVRGTILKKLTAVSTDDEQVRVALSGPVYDESANVVRFLLVRLAEQGMNRQSWHDLWERRQTSSGKEQYLWTIEHVLPQSPHLVADWISMLGGADAAREVQERSVHRLGNLTLTPYNAALGKMSFTEKRDRVDDDGLPIGYKNDLILNSELASRSDWGEDAIDARTRDLTSRVLETFPLT